MKKKIKDIKNNKEYKKDFVYLIEKINNATAFLFGDEKVIYAVESRNNKNKNNVDTEYLSLRLNVYIDTIEHNPEFKPGNYDLLIFNEDINETMFSSFVEVCRSYSDTYDNLDFSDFFYNLIDLFKIPSEKKYKNAIGCFGELYLMKESFEKYGIDISPNWHKENGSNSKYDFCFKDLNLEVKTTNKSEAIFVIKHDQIFNDKNNYLAAINIYEDNAGKSIENYYDYFKKNPIFSKDIKFQIKLEAEKLKINKVDFSEKHYSIKRVRIFDCKKLKTIGMIPNCITNIEYNYNFENIDYNDLKTICDKYKVDNI